MGSPYALAISPDGRNVYAATIGAIEVYARDPASGGLQQLQGTAGCVDEHSRQCTRARPLEAARVAVSPDGHHVYVTSNVVVNNSYGGGEVGTAIISLRRRPDGGCDSLPDARGAWRSYRPSPPPQLHTYAGSRDLVRFQRGGVRS